MNERPREIVEIEQVEAEVETARANVSPLQARWCQIYVGPARFNSDAAARMCPCNPRTARSWRAKSNVRAYIDALLRREAQRIMVSRSHIVQELAFIAMADATEAFRTVTERAAGADVEPEASPAPENDSGDPDASGEYADTRLKSVILEVHNLPRHIARSIKKLKLDDRGRVAEIEFHDKLKALHLLGMAYRMWEEAEREGEPVDNRWTGFQIIAPPQRETDR